MGAGLPRQQEDSMMGTTYSEKLKKQFDDLDLTSFDRR